MNAKFAIEHFHLVFLSFLDRKLDKRLYALKGGCNLRFYFQSIRYSEDIDLDVTTIAELTLKKKVEDILKSRPFLDMLSLHGLGLEEWSAPKQTATVQRWKARLNISALGFSLPTKIEFSRRGLDSGHQNEDINPQILSRHQLSLISVPHYTAASAIQQKIEALIHRTETQARDVFDLDWLIKRSSVSSKKQWQKKDIDQAIENTMSISFSDFSGQVLTYLEPELSVHYNKQKWQSTQDFLVKKLEELK